VSNLGHILAKISIYRIYTGMLTPP